MDDLSDLLCRLVASRHFNQGRVAQDLVRHLLDLVRIGCGEQEVLAPFRNEFQDLLDVVDEAHVEHPVGLVENQDFDFGEIHVALAGMIEESPWCRDQNIDPAAQLANLRANPDPTEDDGRAQVEQLAVGPDTLADLRREFASWGQHEGAGSAQPCPAARFPIRLR